MKTKDRIIAQAISTYNAKGVANVTSRDLAKQLGISHGNLEYHFPNKEALLLAIYEQMRAEISEAYENRGEGQDAFEAFHRLLRRLGGFQQKYLFFNLDFLEIRRNFPKVGALLDQTLQTRHQQLTQFFRRFQQAGYLRADMDEAQYARLRHTIMVLITFWKKQQAVLPTDVTPDANDLAEHIWALLLPVMTAQGKAVFDELNIVPHA